MLWPITSSKVTTHQFDTIDMYEVLYEFDGPKIFTSKDSNNQTYLWYESAEDFSNKRIRFLVTPTTDSQIEQLKLGHKTVYDLLKQAWLWAVDLTYDMTLANAWALGGLDDVPAKSRPEPHVTLYPEHMPLLSYRLIGPGLQEGQVPASVISRAVKGPTAALKRIFESLSQGYSSGRPEESFRRSYDLPAARFAYNSFEVAFSEPPFDQLDFDGESAYEAGSSALEDGLQWLVNQSSKEPSIIVLEALKELTPPAHGQIERAEIRGRLIKSSAVFCLNRQHRRAITEALAKHQKTDHELIQVSGQIRELDKDNFSFILRNRPNDENELKCIFTEEQYDDVVEHFSSETFVSATGRLKRSSNLLEIGDIEPTPNTNEAPEQPL
ncbi:hypothetical protein [Aquipseudomonas alcaligenes]|uniref:Uncharacterized protein n=1 Tax=Aquipseudomonas alcaligenes TaxID=43263 RepID=A0AA37FQ57_AQUAC|nr:hypothetical protein [Pseudomonas alcaligenes]BCR22507.1 hypothetical protein KAM426_00340 [Pseudomonas alcaligenes]GIZ72936.1 hypothetical protein KAM429_36970 [Pseudomonas alcaligenes]GIZ77343.1 hypothetical protein KAM430_37520 [Pseudomonas alcaligenes]GIZ81596.1 hypothetical protein KAM432_36440 [Pseudomonas alcaligenes]GIZ85906.1 hypothetical protein KAM434_36010 [Pseudomonas alcaligenes]